MGVFKRPLEPYQEVTAPQVQGEFYGKRIDYPEFGKEIRTRDRHSVGDRRLYTGDEVNRLL